MGAIDVSPRPGIVTFDVYTALFDVSSLVPVVAAKCEGAVNAASLVRAWRAKQLEYAQLTNSLPGGRIPFRTVTRRALEHTFAGAGLPLSAPDAEELVAAWNHLTPWPEAQRTLTELKARGHALAMLSNGDEDMLRAASAMFECRFDHFFASDRAGVYKPHPAIYALPMERLGLDARDVLHVAGSGNDVLGAKLAGLRCAWSNRAGDRMIDPAVQPDHEMRDLGGLLEFL